MGVKLIVSLNYLGSLVHYHLGFEMEKGHWLLISQRAMNELFQTSEVGNELSVSSAPESHLLGRGGDVTKQVSRVRAAEGGGFRDRSGACHSTVILVRMCRGIDIWGILCCVTLGGCGCRGLRHGVGGSACNVFIHCVRVMMDVHSGCRWSPRSRVGQSGGDDGVVSAVLGIVGPSG